MYTLVRLEKTVSVLNFCLLISSSSLSILVNQLDRIFAILRDQEFVHIDTILFIRSK